MALWSGLGLSGGAAVGAVGAAAVAVAGYIGYQQFAKPQQVPIVSEQAVPAQEIAVEVTEPIVALLPEVETATAMAEAVAKPAVPAKKDAKSETASETSGAQLEAPAPAAETAVVAVVPEPSVPPSFDLVRVDPEGAAAIAGTAGANVELQVLVDGIEVTRITTDLNGKFVALFDVATLGKPQIVEIIQTGQAALPSAAASIIIAPFEQPADIIVAEVAPTTQEPNETVAEPDAISEPIAQPVSTVAPDAATEIANAPVAAPVKAPVAPAVLIADAEGVKVLQPAGGQGPAVQSNVVIDAISYNETGEVQLAGRGHADRSVRFYLDNQSVRTSRIELDGTWRTPLPQVDAGIYTLRVDEIDDQGKVTSRFETPFLREEIATVLETIAPTEDNELVSNQDRSLIVDNTGTPEISEGVTVEPAVEVEVAVETVAVADEAAPSSTVTQAPATAIPTPIVQTETPAAVATATAVTEATIAPQATPEKPSGAGTHAGIITVQPGYTLWAIARDNYGKGDLFVQVYEANKSQIKDPNLIYPGQIFSLPSDD